MEFTLENPVEVEYAGE